jgi:26S proteasome non-ATPase regulatory subunit 9
MASLDDNIVRHRILRLQSQREMLEIEANAISAELQSVGPNGEPPAGIKGPLVDKEGFPRSDIDLYKVREQRQRLSVINTDYTGIMKELERDMEIMHLSFNLPLAESVMQSNKQIHQNASVEFSTSSSAADVAKTEVSFDFTQYQPYAVIDEVFLGSPAQRSGLRVGDHVIGFSTIVCSSSAVNKNSSALLSKIPAVVKNYFESISSSSLQVDNSTNNTKTISSHIPVHIMRSNEYILVELRPAVWGGKGLLGCHISPL